MHLIAPLMSAKEVLVFDFRMECGGESCAYALDG